MNGIDTNRTLLSRSPEVWPGSGVGRRQEVCLMLYVELTEAQRAELQQVSRQAVGRVALRAQMVLLSDRRYSVPQIAAIHGCGQDVVRDWLHRYQDRGVAGL